MKKIDVDKKINLVEKKKLNKKPIIVLIIVVLIAAAGYFVYSKYYKASSNSQDGEMSQKEIDRLLHEVGELIRLPEGVQPAIATINDVEALIKEQKFFLGAKNGDKILIYKDKAIVYDPDKKILINVGPVIGGNGDGANNNDAQKQVQPQTQDQKINLDIRNGSGVSGAASKLASTFGNDFNIIQTIDASKEYDKTILVNLTGKDASALEKEFGVKSVNKLPDGEKLSIADFVIIIGK